MYFLLMSYLGVICLIFVLCSVKHIMLILSDVLNLGRQCCIVLGHARNCGCVFGSVCGEV